MALVAKSDYVAVYGKFLPIKVGYGAIDRVLTIAESVDAGMLYSDHYALSLHVLDEESFLFGAADGIYKGYFDGRCSLS